ncbi:MAG: hypothetical protein JSR59_04310 [Proteobacteria bacterium]|nr:hypothetical protein [Pseudomonadota bacterium]
MHESGFSWLAAISLPAWALQRRLYGVAVAGLLFGLGLGLLANLLQLSGGWQFCMYAVNFLGGGFLAGHLQRWMLRRRGYFITAEEPLPRANPGAPKRT